VTVIATTGDRAVDFTLLFGSFGKLALGTLIQHTHDGPNHFEVAELFCGDVE